MKILSFVVIKPIKPQEIIAVVDRTMATICLLLSSFPENVFKQVLFFCIFLLLPKKGVQKY